MIGDCNPHGPNYPLNTQNIDWRTECELLKENKIRVYAVQALNRCDCCQVYSCDYSQQEGGDQLLQGAGHQDRRVPPPPRPVLLHRQLHDGHLLQGGGRGRAGQLRDRGGRRGEEDEPGAAPDVCHAPGLFFNQREFNSISNQGREIKTGFGEKRSDGLVPINPARFQVFCICICVFVFVFDPSRFQVLYVESKCH